MKNYSLIRQICCYVLWSLGSAFVSYGQSNDCAPCVVATSPTGPNYAGQTLIDYNFTALGTAALKGANFQGATILGGQFQNMDLTGANFSGAFIGPSTKGNADFSGAILDHTCFYNADLSNANLQFTVFKATDLSCANLIGATFGPLMTIQASSDNIRTKFTKTVIDFVNFPINNWPSAYWAATDLSYTRFSGMTSKNFNLKGKNISYGIVKGINWSNFDLRQCTMTGVDLTDANLSFALMDSVIIDQSKLIGVTASGVSMVGSVFYQANNGGRGADLSGGFFVGANFTNANLQYATLSGANFGTATLQNVHFDYANLESSNNYSVAIFSGAGLNNTFFANAHINSVTFTNSYLENAQFNNLTAANTNFAGATMPGANFQQSVLQGVNFTGAVLQNAKFNNTTLDFPPSGGSSVNFSCTQLGGANFSNATVRQANFSNAVMLMADSCCATLSGTYCGTVSINNTTYGATIFPPLTVAVTCPNGQNAICSGSQWAIPNWTTANCSSPPKDQRMWYKPDCNGSDTLDMVNFADLKLQQCISQQLYGNPNQQISKNVAAQMLVVDCPCKGISSLGGLENFTILQQLDVSCNVLTDGDFFTKLPTLQSLKVQNNRLPSLNVINVSNLSYLDASYNQITSTVQFNSSTFLNYLNLSHNRLSIQDISQQTSLAFVDLSFNGLTTILNTQNSASSLANLKNLTTLYLENNSLTTIGNISGLFNKGMGKLEILDLACNPNFQCNTLGLGTTQMEQNFLKSSQCGQNNQPGCN